jgi:uncharacterized membrane protein YccF (DUF307 family)
MLMLNESRSTPGISPISVLLNLLWIIFGGLWMAAGWMIAAIIMAITIIGLPWTRAAFNIAAYTLLPFGQKVVSRAAYGHNDMGTGPLGVLGNVLWLILAGWWLALGHLITAIMLAITIVGIPFAWAHVKLAGLALWPIGKMIVPAWVCRTTFLAVPAGVLAFQHPILRVRGAAVFDPPRASFGFVRIGSKAHVPA